uniref:hypothetical protein n=1 Tax=Thiolapillus sp. TaxID=2017437 RepID=UPI003AF7DD67
FDNLLVPQPSWSPSTTQQLRKLVAAPYLSPNDWTPRLDAYVASPLALCARRVSSAASRLLGTTRFRFALHGWQQFMIYRDLTLESFQVILVLAQLLFRRVHDELFYRKGYPQGLAVLGQTLVKFLAQHIIGQQLLVGLLVVLVLDLVEQIPQVGVALGQF